MNHIFFLLIVISFGCAAWQHSMPQLSSAILDASQQAVDLTLGLLGTTTFFLGLMKVAEAGGLLTIIAKLLRPLLVRLFPAVPPTHPAMGAMVMNLSANILGLGNAATPFGIRAMQALETLNPHPGVATNAMVLFLAINTSSVTLLPTGVIALRASLGSTNPASILSSTLFATLCSTAFAIMVALTLSRVYPEPPATISLPTPASTEKEAAYPLFLSLIAFGMLLVGIPLSLLYANIISLWLLPTLTVGLLTFGYLRKVAVYEQFVEGAKDGFNLVVRIIPYLVAILSAIAMFKASGALGYLTGALRPFTAWLGLPSEALPMALLRPLSGSGSFGLLGGILSDPITGPDSYIGVLVSTIQGSTETTFYVLAVYFGAIQIKRIRHALMCGLLADAAGVLGAIIAVSYIFADGVDAKKALTHGLPLLLGIAGGIYGWYGWRRRT